MTWAPQIGGMRKYISSALIASALFACSKKEPPPSAPPPPPAPSPAAAPATPPTPAKHGLCLGWEEGDALHMSSCRETSQEACAAGRKPAPTKNWSFPPSKAALAVYAKKSANEYDSYEMRTETCPELNRDNARDVEKSMSGQWGYAVYSVGLKAGERAYIYGKDVPVRDKPAKNAAVLFRASASDRVTLREKSKEMDKGKELSAHWFKVAWPNGKEGWVFGEFLHPDPQSPESVIGNP
jgi:hypothetical protein